MEARIITEETIERFHAQLLLEEKSAATVEKYIRDAKAFMLFTDGAAITKEMVIGYKQKLIEDGYAVRSVNSILASVNSSRLVGLQSEKPEAAARNLLFRGKRVDKSGVYAPCEYGKRKEERAAVAHSPDDLRHRHPRQRIAVYHR